VKRRTQVRIMCLNQTMPLHGPFRAVLVILRIA